MRLKRLQLKRPFDLNLDMSAGCFALQMGHMGKALPYGIFHGIILAEAPILRQGEGCNTYLNDMLIVLESNNRFSKF